MLMIRMGQKHRVSLVLMKGSRSQKAVITGYLILMGEGMAGRMRMEMFGYPPDKVEMLMGVLIGMCNTQGDILMYTQADMKDEAFS
jgi:hypothetical protein